MKTKAILAMCILAAACSRGADWTAFVYPDIENIPDANQVQNFTIGS